jgi:hypothetical protein
MSKQNNPYRIKKIELLNENNISDENNERIVIMIQNIIKNMKNLSLRFSFFTIEYIKKKKELKETIKFEKKFPTIIDNGNK